MSLIDLDKKYIWHPFTQMKGAKIKPIVRGEGVWLYGEDGEKYIDAVSSWWVKIHGHSHPYIGQKLQAQFSQLDHVIFAGFTHPVAVEAAERLVGKLPSSIDKIFYSDNGSTAVEVAVKMAFQFSYNAGALKTKVVAFEGAYHGDTFGGMSLGWKSSFTAPFEEHLFEVNHVPTPTEDNINSLCEQFEALLKTGEVAAFIYEPLVQGVRGMVMYESEHLDRLLAIAKKHKVLCIADEVMTGFGRTGTLFASDQMKHQPDLMALSKGLTAGVMALGVTAMSNEVYNGFYSDDRSQAFLHGHSFAGNPMACAAVCANLDLLEQPEFEMRYNRLIEKQKNFRDELDHHPSIKEARVKGCILAIELNVAQEGYYSNIGPKAYDFFLERGVVMRPLGNVLIIMPPYIIQPDELEVVYETTRTFLEAYQTATL